MRSVMLFVILTGFILPGLAWSLPAHALINPLDANFLVNTTTAGTQHQVDVARAAIDGRFVVVWADTSTGLSRIMARLYTSDGQASTSDTVVSVGDALSHTAPAVAMDSSGNFVVVWEAQSIETESRIIYCRRFSRDGVPPDIFASPVIDPTSQVQITRPVVAMDEAGNFTVVWQAPGSAGDTDLFLKHYTADGTAISDILPVNTGTAGEQSDAAIGMNQDGEFMIVWQSQEPPPTQPDTLAQRVYARSYGSDRAPAGPDFAVSSLVPPDTPLSPDVSLSDDGAALVAWSAPDDQNGLDILARRYAADSSAASEPFRVNSTTVGDQTAPTVAADDTDSYVVAWASTGSVDSTGIFAQFYTQDGAPDDAETRVDTPPELEPEPDSGSPAMPAAAMDNTARTVIVWQSPANNQDIVGQLYGSPLPEVSIRALTPERTEGDTGTIAFAFEIALDRVPEQTVNVGYRTIDGTATLQDDDYRGSTNNIIFTPQDNQPKLFTVLVHGDTTFEQDETFSVVLDDTADAVINPEAAAALVTILNDDPEPVARIRPSTLNLSEGDAGTTTFLFTVELSNPADQPITVDYRTDDATATLQDNDYREANGTLLFAPGEGQTQQILVSVSGDAWIEDDETFIVSLLASSGATVSPDQRNAQGTIINDDQAGVVIASLNSTQVIEDDAASMASYTVALSSRPRAPVVIMMRTDGQIELGVDEANFAVQLELRFTPDTWNNAQLVTVRAVDDVAFEGAHTGTISYQVVSDDADYDDFPIPINMIDIIDDETNWSVFLPSVNT